MDALDWVTINSINYTSTSPDTTGYLRHLWRFDPIYGVTGVRIITGTNGTCIDELEVRMFPEPATMSLLGLGALALWRKRRTA